MNVKNQFRLLSSTPGCTSLFAALLLTGCGPRPDKAANATNSSSPNSVVETVEEPDALRPDDHGADAQLPTDMWLGRWAGPEGLFLDIQPSPNGQPGHYAITNKDTLDRQADYTGVREGSTIRFVRDGKALAIRSGSGSDTGFKYLAEKTDCLILIPNQEGYCR